MKTTNTMNIKHVPYEVRRDFALAAKVAGVNQAELFELLTVYAMQRYDVEGVLKRRQERTENYKENKKMLSKNA